MLLEQLGYLLEVARCHSISIAAERLHLTQPAVSQAIKSIETELGETIFVRSKNGVFLTEAGERLLPCVERIMAAAGEMRQIAAQGGQPQEEISGYLRLSVNPALSFGIFQSLLPIFSQRYPQVKVYIHERISDEVVLDILQGQCDFGVFINDAASLQKYSAYEELLIGHLFTEKMFIITQAASPLAMRSSVTLEDIKDYPLSTSNFNEGDWQRGNLFDAAIDMNVVLTTDNIFLMQAHVEKGASIGIMTNSSLKRLALKKELAAVPLHFAYPSSVYCVYRRGQIEQALVDILVDMIYEFS